MQSLPMNPQNRYDATPLGMLRMLCRHGHLIRQMLTRDIAQRYRGSVLGLLWSFVTPLLMLAVYTVVFTVVFEARWASRTGTNAPPATGDFALILFCGLILHAFLADCLSRSPSVILNNANFVKKVVFPLEILPVVVIGSAMFHFAMSLCVLLAAELLFTGSLPLTALYLPLVLAPFFMLTAGLSWGLASVGVYLRDIGQLIGLAVMILMFLSPIFYPPESLPEAWRPYLIFNPLTIIIENARAVLLWGHAPNWPQLGLYALVSLTVMLLGFAWFQKTRKGFADVL